MTRGELGALAGLTMNGAARIVAGQTRPNLETAARLAAALGVTLDRFARAWMETRRRRVEREASRREALAARERFILPKS